MQIRKLLILVMTTLFLIPCPSSAEDGHRHENRDSSERHIDKRTEHHEHDHDSGHKHGKTSEHEQGQDSHAGHGHGGEHEEGFIEISGAKAEKAGVTISKAVRGSLSREIVLPGEVVVNGDSLVHVAPRFAGTLKKVKKHIGESVSAGDLLAIVQSNESLSAYEIHSDTAGVVIDKDASVGEFVTNDKIIFTIANFDTVWVNAAVHTKDLSYIKEGLTASVESKNISLSQTARIDYIRPTLSEITRTALVRIVLDNSSKKWLPGMFVKVVINRPSKDNKLIIPIESAVFAGNEYIAFVKGTS
ncbi:MAG: efflux RND transporter periplasmic adaptor subunit, partial [Bdellovibrionales bacterium]|nr:efflux RND transporter periplasmic adaptor subunit [Bdellovibrionales bacterium]